MENVIRAHLPDFIPAHERELKLWFLANFELEFLFGGYWINPAPWHIPRRKITDNFIVFPNSPMYIETDRERRIVEKNEFFIIPQGHWHSYGLSEDVADSTEHIILHMLVHSPSLYNFFEIFPSCFHRLDNYACWYAKFKQHMALYDYSQKAARKYAEALVTELVLEMLRIEADKLAIPVMHQDHRIATVIEYIRENFISDLVIEDLADRAGLKPVQFRKLFLRELGQAPKKFLTSVRIGKAEELLRKTDLNVNEIADATGFRDRNYFSSAFKHATGRTPSEFRNHMQI